MTGKANLAVLGATGVVGRHILEILKELDVPYNTIKFLLNKTHKNYTFFFYYLIY